MTVLQDIIFRSGPGELRRTGDEMLNGRHKSIRYECSLCTRPGRFGPCVYFKKVGWICHPCLIGVVQSLNNLETFSLDHRKRLQNRPTVVYRLFDNNGRLLYVGITHNWKQRRLRHRADKPWWGDVDESQTRFEEFPDRPSARQRELAVIARERPPYCKEGMEVAS